MPLGWRPFRAGPRPLAPSFSTEGAGGEAPCGAALLASPVLQPLRHLAPTLLPGFSSSLTHTPFQAQRRPGRG